MPCAPSTSSGTRSRIGASPGLDDFDRPLAARGRRAAPAVAEWMNANGCAPGFVLCSTARRAAETWSLVSEVLDTAPEVAMSEELYLASPQRLLDLAREIPDRHASAMMIGHNPGCHQLAAALAGEGPADLLDRLAAAYPTGALAGIDFDAASWSGMCGPAPAASTASSARARSASPSPARLRRAGR